MPMAMAGHAPAPLFLLWFVSALLAAPPSPSRAATPVTVGLIIDAGSPVGRIANTTVPMALEDFYAAFPNASSRVRIVPHDTGGDVVAAASAALLLVAGQAARAILGPQSSVESAFVADLATRAEVPVVSFSATSPSVSPATARFFARAALSDATQAQAIAALATYFRWRRVVPVYQDDDYGAAFVPFLVDALTAAGAEVPYRCALPATASPEAVAAALYRMESEQTRAFVLHTRPALAESVFAAAVEAGMVAEGYAWVITDGLTGLLSSIAPPQGVIGLAPYLPTTPRLRDVKKRWAHRYMRDHPHAELGHAEMGCYAVWAYDAAWAVAAAAEQLTPGDLSPPAMVGSIKNGPTDFAGIGKSRSGQKFLQAITGTKFDGIGGRFELVDGELAVTAFRVVNIVENGKETGIGFWTNKDGLTSLLGRDGAGGLAPVIWPGKSTVVPTGWVQPTSGRKLRVAVPGKVDPGYRPLLHIDVDPVTNRTAAGGFAVEVFEAAVRLLPYALPFEYVKVDSMPYDKLVQQVGNGAYDAVVADMTITASRSTYVDFTLPYMASGISMVVPVRDRRSSKRAWVFLKPLRYDLWLVATAFFLFTGFAVWAIEHRDNAQFRGPPSHQAGTLLYFGFSTLVFAHRENLMSNLSRLAVVVWVFVVLILQSSYTASLTSMLTVPELEPAVADFAALWRGGAAAEKVGVMNNSYVRRSMDRAGFPQARLVPYRAVQSFHDALLNGTIAAVVDETPYLKIFLKTYCDNFTMVGQLNKTGGFGFAFPKGSPYVTDMSRALLNLTESDEMNLIERKWFGDAAGGCPVSASAFTSRSLSFGSFWGLFLVTGATSLLCCAVHLATFVAANRRSIRQLASHPSWKGMLRRFAELFDEKDLSSHTFRTKDGGSVAGRNDAGGVSPAAATAAAHNETGTPLRVSNHTYTGEWSVETASPAAGVTGPGDIELGNGGDAASAGEELEIAPDPDGSGENQIKRERQASN